MMRKSALVVRPKSGQAGQNWRTRPKAPDARQTNAEVRERMCDYVTEPRWRITPQMGFSAAFLRIAVIGLTAVFFSAGITSVYAYASGEAVWVRKFDGPAGRADYGVDIAMDASKNVYVAGGIDDYGVDGDFGLIKYKPNGRRVWFRRYSAAGRDHPESPVAVGIDGKGAVYVAGSVEIEDNDDFQIIKYSPSGAVKWMRRYGAPGKSEDAVTAMAVSSQGDVYVAGVSDRFQGRQFDYLTVKYNAAGEKKWVRRYDGPAHREDWANDLAIDKKGNAYITGYSVGTGASSQYLTIKYDRRGRLKWRRRVGDSGANTAKAIAVTGGGNIFVTGTSYSSDGAHNLTVKYGPKGGRQWTRRYAGSEPGNYSGDGIALGRDGSVYVTGESLNFSTGRTDIAAIKYDAQGRQVWVQVYGGQADLDYEFSSAGSDRNGNLYIAGMFEGFDRKADIFAVKYSGDGVPLWDRDYAGRGNVEDRVNSLAVRSDGFAYITGSTYSKGNENIVTIKYAP
ncbi:MAG: SBBP repeat-containing protein [Actinomycetota bacterium]|nr:SBBP repeat-containing protein [Actinomycetota bacterium]